MKLRYRMMLVAAIVATSVGCERKPQPVDSGADDAKLRPEVAVARGEASPTFDQVSTSPTPSP